MTARVPELPIGTFTLVKAEFNRLANEAPHVARRVAAELKGYPFDEDEGLSEIEALEEEIEMLQQELERLKDREGLGFGFELTGKARDAAEVVHALLQQYEGIHSEALEEVL